MKARPLWISRPLINWRSLIPWAEEAGIRKIMPPEHLHMTIATVREPVRWDELALHDDEIVIPDGPKRTEIFAFTIKAIAFSHPAILERHAELARIFPTMDHVSRIRPHVSLYKGGRMPIVPYSGELVFGPERAMEFDEANVKGIKHVRVQDLREAI